MLRWRENRACLLSLVEREQFPERDLIVHVSAPTAGRGHSGVKVCVRGGAQEVRVLGAGGIECAPSDPLDRQLLMLARLPGGAGGSWKRLDIDSRWYEAPFQAPPNGNEGAA